MTDIIILDDCVLGKLTDDQKQRIIKAMNSLPRIVHGSAHAYDGESLLDVVKKIANERNNND